jgi:hypothetical protein
VDFQVTIIVFSVKNDAEQQMLLFINAIDPTTYLYHSIRILCLCQRLSSSILSNVLAKIETSHGARTTDILP